VQWVSENRRGNADLVTYFFLRGIHLLGRSGGMGLLATNTIAQGDSREVGLDYLTETGWTITRAVKSRTWPGDASLEIAQVWLHGEWLGPGILEDWPVTAISSALEPKSRVSGTASRLRTTAGKCFQGTVVVGTGFILDPEEADRLITQDLRNRNVLRNYSVPGLRGRE
jgi:hypothetical protein